MPKTDSCSGGKRKKEKENQRVHRIRGSIMRLERKKEALRQGGKGREWGECWMWSEGETKRWKDEEERRQLRTRGRGASTNRYQSSHRPTNPAAQEAGENGLFCLQLQREAEERTWKYTLKQLFRL
ncbi:unnamed protein product [Pleuronectes platessa]|uniref:Uncharacterized protein n=1 Tax=Pleuronectes platessa TaxID=8262 RepID=A0A9N7US10_PLEPL|nr:unnamed protein product [Pleuronectes platessa]